MVDIPPGDFTVMVETLAGDFTVTVDHWLGDFTIMIGGDTSLVSAQGSSLVGGGAETSLSSLFCMTAHLLLLSFHVTDR